MDMIGFYLKEDMKTYTDSQLIIAYQNGNERALEILITRYQKDLFSYIFYKIMEEDLANDIFQDTFMKIIVTLRENKYSDQGKFILWAKRIAHNLIIDHFRVKTKHSKISETSYENEDYSIFDILQSQEENIEEKIITAQINADLFNIITCLPASQQEVIKLRFFDNLSFKEIAEQTDSSINTTLGRVRYALINLRKIMEEKNIILTR